MSFDTPVLDPRTAWFLKFLKDVGRPQVFELPVAEARALYVNGQALFPVPPLPARMEDRDIPVGPKGSVRLRVVYPESASSGAEKQSLPVVMFFHGGGWVLGEAATYDYLLRQMVSGTGAAVVFVEYSRSPEERFPVALEECYAAAKWVAEHGSELGIDASRMAIAGDSAGANLGTVVCRWAKERGGPKIAAQALIYPPSVATFATPSFKQFAEGYFLTAQTSRWFWHQYAPDRATDSDPNACPLMATLDQLKDMPPALVITAETDILRDEGEYYARKLMQAGVSVTCTRYLGTIHGFLSINALADSPPTKAAVAQMNGWLRQALAGKVPGDPS
jgi:acetyl esterase/lipase